MKPFTDIQKTFSLLYINSNITTIHHSYQFFNVNINLLGLFKQYSVLFPLITISCSSFTLNNWNQCEYNHNWYQYWILRVHTVYSKLYIFSYSLFIFVLFLLSQQSRLSSYSIRYNIPLSIRRTDRLGWNQFHEFYEDYVSFYQHQTDGSCDTSYFLYSLPQEYYYINEGSASLKENEICVFHKKYICSSPQILNRRFSKFLVSNLPVQLNQHND